MTTPSRCAAIALSAIVNLAGLHPAQAAGATCQARSGATAPTVVELYTSEGCSSCPPADRWLSQLKARPDLLPLAFHVTYWDSLGWPDRYALPEATARQRELANLAGSSQVYTPQVRVDGRDWRSWPQLPAPSSAVPLLALNLQREGETVTASIPAAANSAARYSGYWAVVEDGHITQVRAGENAGETLRHDHVVRLYKAVKPWAAREDFSAQLQVSRGDVKFTRRVVFVVTDPATARPVQALAISC
jgi:hypothetical protein